MQVTIVDLSIDEKQKVISFLKEKEEHFNKRSSVMSKELGMLKACRENPPNGAPTGWLRALDDRIKEYSSKITSALEAAIEFTNTIKGFDSKAEIPLYPTVRETLGELHNKEKGTKQVDARYRYYPRLKKAKEAALYVFAGKIKTIMESENVKVA